MAKVPYLVLDDLGTQSSKAWVDEMLYHLIDSRYCENRFTIVTTNQPIEEMKEVARGRLFSRLSEMCHVLEMAGPDYRQHMGQAF